MLLPPIILTINLITEINHKPNKQQPSTLREKCPHMELFLVHFSRIRT